MSCAGKGYGTNPQSDYYLYSQFYTSNVTPPLISKNNKNCRKYKGFYPSFNPILYNLSITTSIVGVYTVVYVTGSNFLPNGVTFIRFGSVYIPVTYYSSFNLSFVVPLTIVPGNYNVSVVNLYNGNFSSPVNQSYPGNLNFSNNIVYTLT